MTAILLADTHPDSFQPHTDVENEDQEGKCQAASFDQGRVDQIAGFHRKLCQGRCPQEASKKNSLPGPKQLIAQTLGILLRMHPVDKTIADFVKG